MKLHHGDCYDILKTMPDNSIDSVVTDPPYGLGEVRNLPGLLSAWVSGEDGMEFVGKKGFMGKEWDKCVPPPKVWREVFRVMKPGAHLLVFAGTRTQDLMGISIRLGGFELRDEISVYGFESVGELNWLYGCLTADAEILTEHGWVKGVEVTEGTTVAAWDSKNDRILLQPVSEKIVAPYDGLMMRLVNQNTDQLLTPNHRVFHRPRKRKMTNWIRKAWFEKEWEVCDASELPICSIKLPLASFHEGVGVGGTDYARFLAWIWTEGGFDNSGTGVRCYQSSVNPTHVEEIHRLMRMFAPKHKHYTRERKYKDRTYTENAWFFSGEIALKIRGDLPDKSPPWSLLWRMTLDEKMAFFDAAMDGDGSKTGLGFYQKNPNDRDWFQTLLHVSGMQGWQNPRKNAVSVHHNPVTELQSRHHKNRPAKYTGMVWCVRVPTGAFVARRNGKVFITGNSGFPKSMDISKAIDKAAGAEREILDVVDPRGTYDGKERSSIPINTRWRESEGRDDVRDLSKKVISKSATPEAKQWEGWGTALKPAHEPILVFRKPLSEPTVAANVLKWGTGGLNIDDSRIHLSKDDPNIRDHTKHERHTGSIWGNAQGSPKNLGEKGGRFPANLVFVHHPECELVGEKKVKGHKGYPNGPGGMCSQEYRKKNPDSNLVRQKTFSENCKDNEPWQGYAGSEGKETVSDWNCHPDCPVKELDEQSGTTRSGRSTEKHDAYEGESNTKFVRGVSSPDNQYDDTGGASRFFKQVHPKQDDTPGRWPANLIFLHHPDCEAVGEKSIKSDGHFPASRGKGGLGTAGHGGQEGLEERHTAGETVIEWNCHPDCPVKELDGQGLERGMHSAGSKRQPGTSKQDVDRDHYFGMAESPNNGIRFGDTGGASRFFYQAKVSKKERNAGLPEGVENKHPTVKPIALLEYLIKLVTPPGGTTLDLFMGSGSSGVASVRNGFGYVGIEVDQESFEVAEYRIKNRPPIEEKSAGKKAKANWKFAAEVLKNPELAKHAEPSPFFDDDEEAA